MLHNCDICECSDATEITCAREYTNGQPIHICGNCGFTYVRERRSAEEVALAWDGIWGESYNSNWPGVKARLYYVTEWFDQKFGWQGKSVLDIGAGEGTFLKFLQPRGAVVIGLEPCKANCAKMQKAGVDAVYDWVGRAEPFAKFDVATILWTLENSADCRAMIRYARDSLKPDGLLVIATGSRILASFKKPLSSYFSKLPADLHAFRFGYEDLNALGYSEGMERVEHNDFMDRDELLVVFRSSAGGLRWKHDAGRAVRVHRVFDDWHRLWP